MFQDEEDTRDLSAEVGSTPKKFQNSIQNDAVRLYQEIEHTERNNLDLVLNGSRPFDPPAIGSMGSDTGREVARSGGHWIVGLETDSLIEMPCILADARTAATAIVCHTHRLATAQEVEKLAGPNHGDRNRLTADTIKREVGK